MVSVIDGGRCVFRMYMPHAGSVELVGSFCDWKPESGAIELKRDDEGWWCVTADLPEGDHEFCYLVDGRIWMPDYAAGGVRRSANGRWVSLLSVPASVAPARAGLADRPIGSLAEPRIGRKTDQRDPRREFIPA